MKGGQSDGAAQFRELTNSGFMTISDASAVYTMRRPGEYWNRLTVRGTEGMIRIQSSILMISTSPPVLVREREWK